MIVMVSHGVAIRSVSAESWQVAQLETPIPKAPARSRHFPPKLGRSLSQPVIDCFRRDVQANQSGWVATIIHQPEMFDNFWYSCSYPLPVASQWDRRNSSRIHVNANLRMQGQTSSWRGDDHIFSTCCEQMIGIDWVTSFMLSTIIWSVGIGQLWPVHRLQPAVTMPLWLRLRALSCLQETAQKIQERTHGLAWSSKRTKEHSKSTHPSPPTACVRHQTCRTQNEARKIRLVVCLLGA